MAEKLKVGIAGFGVVGKRRKIYIDRHPNLTVTAVCDKYYNNHPKDEPSIRCYENYQQLLAKEDLDILFVCLPNYIAAEVTMAGLENGLHVFCEKPPGRTVQDIADVIKVEKNNPQLKLKYGFNHRYHESVKRVLEAIDTSELGEVINLRGVYGKSRIIPFSGGWRAERDQAGGGILLDQGIHMVDLMRLFGGNYSEVKSFVSNSYWNHDVEDNAYAIMKNDDGVVAMLNSSATQWQHKFRLDVTFTEGYIELHGILSGSKSYGEEKIVIGKRDEESNNGGMESTVIKFLQDNSWKEEIDEFAASVMENRPIASGTSQDALETMKLVYQIYFNDEVWRKKFDIPDPSCVDQNSKPSSYKQNKI